MSFHNTHIMGGLTGAVCAPSRASIHTGANIFRSGGVSDINPSLSLLPEALRKHGYYTYATGKWHNDVKSFNKSFCKGENIFFGGMSSHYNIPVYNYSSNKGYTEVTKTNYQNIHLNCLLIRL